MSFTAPVIAGLRQLRLSEVSIQDCYNFYSQHKDGIPGAPDLLDLKADDADALCHASIFKAEKHTDWLGLKAYCEAKQQSDLDKINPFLPNWYQKTDDRSNIWVGDTTDIPVDAKTKLANVIANASPALHKSIDELICIPPVNDMDYLQDVVQAMMRVAPLFAWDLGEGDNENFRWAPALCMLGGLSPAVLRVFASCLQHEEAWQHWRSLDNDEDLVPDILDAHKISGYPLGLLRCDFKEVNRVFNDLTLVAANGTLVTPRWYKSMIALHIFKYVRFYGGKEPAIFCAYQGEYNRMKLDPDALHLNLWSKENLSIAKVICQTLGLPFNQTRNGRTWQEDAVTEVMQKLQPLYLPQPRDVAARPDMLVGPAVAFAMLKERKSSLGWCRPQIAITGVARLNFAKCEVVTDGIISDTDVFNTRWPAGSASPEDIATWQLSLPTEVRPQRFSEIIGERIRNWNRLDNDEGICAALDATVTIDLFRAILAGTEVGAAVEEECPLVFILPTGSTVDDTTNQGKTGMARIIAGALVPGLQKIVTRASASTSPPAQRSMAEPLYRFGTAIYDEFLIPKSPEHLLSQQGLQNLATGGTATPGRALENDIGVKTKHPIFFAAKLVENVKDIQNRMLPLFLDVLTAANRCSAEELAEITSGRASIQARWCHLLWCHQRNVLARLSVAIPPGAEDWRFRGHLAAAHLFGSGASVQKYMAAAAEQCASQYDAAIESGLTDNMNLGAKFDPAFYLNEVDEITAGIMASQGRLKLSVFCREVVEGRGKRHMYQALGKMSEPAAVKAMGTHLGTFPNGTFELAGFTFRYFSKRDDNPWKDTKGKVSHVAFLPPKTEPTNVPAA